MDDDNEHETQIRNEALALANAIIHYDGNASRHLARLVRADQERGTLYWFAEVLAETLRGWRVNTEHLEANDVYLVMQRAARSLVEESNG
jgi:hypothetical protein